VRIRDLEIGGGDVKICVPLVSETAGELMREAAAAVAAKADLAEWRMDFCRDAGGAAEAIGLIRALRAALGGIPLLATFRTTAEGGNAQGGDSGGNASGGEYGRAGFGGDGWLEASRGNGASCESGLEASCGGEGYARLLLAVAESGAADAVDVEMSAGEDIARRVIGAAKAAGAVSVASRHYFDGTPPKAEIASQLLAMHAAGADIPKIAAMPSCFGDVLALMSAAYEYTSRAGRPVIAVSMGQLGCVSRVAGGFFGSAVTFCAAGRGSAPGQLGVREARAAMALLGGGRCGG
jgi:3-dehydroquinate dehydratase-1